MKLKASGYTVVCPVCGEQVYVRRIPTSRTALCSAGHPIHISRMEHKTPPPNGPVATAAGYQFVCNNPGCRATNHVGLAEKRVVCESCKTPYTVETLIHSVE